MRTLCMTLAYAGCRLSEALALTADRVDLAVGVLVFDLHVLLPVPADIL